MRIAALFDIHGNLPALEAVLAEIETIEVDRFVIGGDVIAGPMPNECLERLRQLEQPADFIHGNGESEVIRFLATGEPDAITPAGAKMARWVADELTAANQAWIRRWPLAVTHEIPDLGEVLFCHATPQDDVTIFSKSSGPDKLNRIFGDVTADLVVCGHVHVQGEAWQINDTRVVRAGSVGMAFGRTGAGWALIDEDGIHLRHTDYDREAAAARIRQSADPDAEQFVNSYVFSSPPLDTVREFLANLEKAQETTNLGGVSPDY